MPEYAIYRGDELLIIGTKDECAEELSVKPETITFYCTPTYIRRLESRKNIENSLIGVKIEIDELMEI